MHAKSFIASVSLVVCIAGLGCTVTAQPLTPAGQAVNVGKSDPPGSCTQVGPVSAQSGGGAGMYGAQGTYEDALNIFRNKAGAMGANYARMDSQVMPVPAAGMNAFVIHGVAFYCP